MHQPLVLQYCLCGRTICHAISWLPCLAVELVFASCGPVKWHMQHKRDALEGGCHLRVQHVLQADACLVLEGSTVLAAVMKDL